METFQNLNNYIQIITLIFPCFLPYPCGILETQQLFPRTYCTHKTTYAYLFLLMGCWNIQESLESDVNWAGDHY